ncbi:MAG: pyruvate ferredoxin oxidoreductase [bacterium]
MISTKEKKSQWKVIMGNHAVSYAVKLARVQVISAYPITPQTQVVELLSEMVARKELNARFITVESEHSAMAACIGSSITGARSFTATSSHGLALMHEMLHWATGSRTPVVMAVINRALGPPWNIWSDQLDSLAQRDTGWIQIYAESNQEVLDSLLQAFKIAEQVYIPALVVLDAFILSHTAEPVEIYDQELVDAYLPPLNLPFKIQPGLPQGYGNLVSPDLYFEFRSKIQDAMEKALELFDRDAEEFSRIFGRRYGCLEEYQTEDADTVFVVAGAMSSSVKVAVNHLRQEGEAVGVVKLRVFRPFPYPHIRKALSGRKKVIVLDRNLSIGLGGIFGSEIRAALYGIKNPPMVFPYIIGVGGRDVTDTDVRGIYEEVRTLSQLPQKDGRENLLYWGLRK